MDEWGIGIFCEVFGDTPRNRVIEEFLTLGKLDYPSKGIAENVTLPEKITSTIIKDLVKQGLVIPTRKVRGLQFYTFNKNNEQVKVLQKVFSQLLDSIAKEYSQKQNQIIQT